MFCLMDRSLKINFCDYYGAKYGWKYFVVTLSDLPFPSFLCLNSSRMLLPSHPWLHPAQAQQEEVVVEVEEVKEED